jgi:hypothetical protein
MAGSFVPDAGVVTDLGAEHEGRAPGILKAKL